MTQVLVFINADTAFVVSDSLLSNQDQRQCYFRKVFKINNKMLGATLGHAAGLQILVSDEVQKSNTIAEAKDAIKKEWESYFNQYKDELVKRGMPQTFILVGIENNEFHITQLSGGIKDPLCEIQPKVYNRALYVYGPINEALFQASEEYERIAKKLIGCPDDEILSIVQWIKKLEEAIEAAVNFQKENEQSITLGLPATGWYITKSLSFTPIGVEFPVATTDNVKLIQEELQKVINQCMLNNK